MKTKIAFVIISIAVFCACDSCPDTPIHLGKRKIQKKIVTSDTLELKCDSISWNGNFFCMDNFLYFADTYYCCIARFDWKNGKCVERLFGRGHGRKEFSNLLYAYPIHGMKHCVVVYDASSYMYVCDLEKERVLYKIAMRKDNQGSYLYENFEDAGAYNIMEMSDVGEDFYSLDSVGMLVPLSFSKLDEMGRDGSFYKYGHIWGVLNIKTAEIEQLKGQYPLFYLFHSATNFESFRYAKIGDEYISNHSTDSLIYCYNKDFKITHTFGVDSPLSDRKYTEGYKTGFKYLCEDLKHVSVNSGVLYLRDKKLFVRTICHKISSNQPSTTIQVYLCGTFDLIAENTFPGIFQLIHNDGDVIYGVELNSNSNNFNVYSFQLKNMVR